MLDRAARLAGRLLEAPLGVFSLLDTEGDFFGSALGLPRSLDLGSDESQLAHSLCRWIAAEGQPLFISDLRTSVEQHPFEPAPCAAGEPDVRACAGVPLRSENGALLGSLCVLDTRVRYWNEDHRQALEDLAAAAVTQIELRRSWREAVTERERYARLVDDVAAVVWEADPATWRLTFVSEQAEKLFGYPRSQWLEEPNFRANLIHADDREPTMSTGMAASAAGRDHECEYRAVAADGRVIWLRDRVRVILNAEGDPEHLVGFMVDITSRKLAEEQLQHVISSAQCLLWEASIEEREGRLYWEHRLPDESAAQRFLPLPVGANQSYAAAWKESRLPPDLAQMQIKSERACREGLPRYVHEYRCRRADGAVRWLFEDVKVERIAEGRWRAVGVCSDITERKEAELALAVRERRFSSLIENSNDVICVLEADGVIAYGSPSIRRLLGYTPDELIGARVVDFVHPQDRKAVLARFQRVLRGRARQPSVSTPYRFRAKDGGWRWLESTASNLANDPIICGVVVNSRDVSERMVAESALRASEERYRRIVETTSEGVWMTDPEGRITFVNPQMAAILGYTPEEMQGRHFLEFLPVEEHSAATARLV